MGFNNPMPVPLREETHKAYKIVRSFVDVNNNGLDKVVPRSVLERAHGFAIFTVAKAGFLFSARAGSGVVIAKLDDGQWSPPSAIAIGGLGFGGQVGAEVTDFLIVLNSRSAVASFMSAGSITLGGNLSVAVGPLGRNAEGSGSLNTKGTMAAMYSYSKTKGLFGGLSVEGSVIAERQDANRIAYGGNPTAKQILTGSFDPPQWAYILIDELNRATGLPGGQMWVDDGKDAGAMGWSNPAGGGQTSRGYAFGEGVGAGGSTPPKNRRRSSSLFSLGGGKDKKDKAKLESGARFPSHHQPTVSQLSYNQPPQASPIADSRHKETTPDQRAAPARPWEARRASSYIPFSGSLTNLSFGKSSANLERKAGPSSETYNANSNHNLAPARPRAESNPRRPYAERPTPSPFSDFGGSRGTSKLATPVDSPNRSPVITNGDSEFGALSNGNGHINGYSNSRSGSARGGVRTSGSTASSGDDDLLGSWDANDRGLTATFSNMNMRNGGSGAYTSRRTSTLPFDDIAEDPDRARLRETTSTFANKEWVGASAGRRAFSMYGAPDGWPGTGPAARDGLDDAYNDKTRDMSRPFDDYDAPPSHASPRPNLQRKPGLDTADGYARAVALYDFAASHDGDLGLKKGQVVVVTGTADGSSDWWRGRVATGGSSEGIFPANHVEVLDIPRQLRGGPTKTQLRTRLLTGLEFD